MEMDEDLQHSNALTVIVTVMVLTPLTTLFVGARVYGCLVILRRRMHLDEWLCIIALIILWLGAALATKLCLSGGGHHWAVLSDMERTKTSFWYWIWTLTSGFILGIPIMAVVSLLCRLFKPPRWHKIVLWAIAIVCTLNFITGSILQVFRCRPRRKPWGEANDSVGNNDCWELSVFVNHLLYSAVFSAAADLCLAVYPAYALRKTAWSRGRKFAMSILLGLTIFATGVASYKARLIGKVAGDDFSYEISSLVVWTMIEGCVILIAACAPTLHPVCEELADYTQRMITNFNKDPASPPNSNDHLIEPPSRRREKTREKGFWSSPKMSPWFSSSSNTTNSTGGLRSWSDYCGRANNDVEERMVEVAMPRTLEDAANLAYPPEAIWKHKVRVGQHSRVHSHNELW